MILKIVKYAYMYKLILKVLRRHSCFKSGHGVPEEEKKGVVKAHIPLNQQTTFSVNKPGIQAILVFAVFLSLHRCLLNTNSKPGPNISLIAIKNPSGKNSPVFLNQDHSVWFSHIQLKRENYLQGKNTPFLQKSFSCHKIITPTQHSILNCRLLFFFPP